MGRDIEKELGCELGGALMIVLGAVVIVGFICILLMKNIGKESEERTNDERRNSGW